MLFAAGFGTRMAPLTDHRPKPMIPVGGRPLIDHALDQVEAYGPKRIVMNLHYLGEQIVQYLEKRPVRFSHETPDILETGGGLRAALPLLGDAPVFTMNTDAVWRGPNPLAHLAAHWNPDVMDALLLCVPPDQAFGHTGPGDFLVDGSGLAERGPGAIYSGLQIIKTDGLDQIEERVFSLNLLWNRMLAARTLHAVAYPGLWCDVGTPSGLAQAETLLAGTHV